MENAHNWLGCKGSGGVPALFFDGTVRKEIEFDREKGPIAPELLSLAGGPWAPNEVYGFAIDIQAKKVFFSRGEEGDWVAAPFDGGASSFFPAFSAYNAFGFKAEFNFGEKGWKTKDPPGPSTFAAIREAGGDLPCFAAGRAGHKVIAEALFDLPTMGATGES